MISIYKFHSPSTAVAPSFLWCCWYFYQYTQQTHFNQIFKNETKGSQSQNETIVLSQQYTKISYWYIYCTQNIMLLLIMGSGIVSTSVDNNNERIRIRSKQQWRKRLAEKTEQQYRGNTHCKDEIGRSNAPTLWCCCFFCYCFVSVAARTDNSVKINSTTQYLTQN